VNIQNCLPPEWTTKTRKSTKTGEYIVLIFKPDGSEYCRSDVEISPALAESSVTTEYLKQKNKDLTRDANSLLGRMGATGGVKSEPVMSGRRPPLKTPVSHGTDEMLRRATENWSGNKTANERAFPSHWTAKDRAYTKSYSEAPRSATGIPPGHSRSNWSAAKADELFKKQHKPAGLRTFKCTLQVSAEFPAGADANTFCNDLSAALRVLMNGRSAQITMGNIEES
jgi:hypothetical protein